MNNEKDISLKLQDFGDILKPGLLSPRIIEDKIKKKLVRQDKCTQLNYVNTG